jgi:hypothetical protein
VKKTDWVEYVEHGQKLRVRAEYGMHVIGDQEPYFSLTGEQYRWERRHWAEDSFGQMTETLTKHFPQLAPTAKWHLCFQQTGPMHYVANGLYWWDAYVGTRLVDKYQLANNPGKSSSDIGLECFKSTIVFGAAGPEELPSVSTPRQAVQAWLEQRLPKLMEAFRNDMAAAGVVVL